ncbi:hypothetical protein VJ923_02455 [Adlercreutzia sp. R25]|uniref:LPXTG cell wall anchor domain-containing protein n=1 Tax=Adlercreutzia shanghongiae TaxID=3111773 RepID=A0ABU6IW19_9ACTN|nr:MULTISPECIES: hypothetical protein [unclassified Adlercreutzia]MEC4272023.1 hypothetical protein [Adlercreutzia sp. R25]MEC4293754.1 hypothetical protein [Adlercreutzia sp. R22]
MKKLASRSARQMLRKGAAALSVALVLGAAVPCLAWASAAENDLEPLEQADEQAAELTSLTLSIYEIVFYDDPSFSEPDGLRLMETKVIDGLKVGETIDLWNYVEAREDFTFFDGWPRYIVLSENPEENRAQLHYRRIKSPTVVNYYLVGEALTAPLMKAAPIVDNVAGVPVSFWKMGSYQVESLPLGAQIASDQCAVDLDGLVYLDADKDSIKVEPLVSANELNLFYTVDTAATLPDDTPVEGPSAPEAPGEGAGGDSDTDDVPGGDGAGTDAPDEGGFPSEDGPSQEGGASEGSAGGVADGGSSEGEGDDDAAQPSAGADDAPTAVIEDEPSPLAAPRAKVATLPQTSDVNGALAGLLVTAVAAAALALAARGASSSLLKWR